MTDNWNAHVTQIGLTKSVHELQCISSSTAEGWAAWKDFVSLTYAHPQMLLTRAIRLINATVRPAHARTPHPTWATAIRQIFRCCYPQGKCLHLKSSFPPGHQAKGLWCTRGQHLWLLYGSFTGLALYEILTEIQPSQAEQKLPRLLRHQN